MATETCKVLLLEDNALEADIIRKTLMIGGHFQVVAAETLQDALMLLRVEHCDIVLADLNLPDSWGLATFSELQAHVSNHPIVVMSGLADEEIAMKTLQGGAQDYLIKGQFEGRLLIRSLRYALERKRAELEREKLIHELREALAQVKLLTGLLPICAWCKKIRNDQGYWDEVEEYFGKNLDARFTHGICPECVSKEMARLGVTPAPDKTTPAESAG